MHETYIFFLIVLGTLGLFIWGHWRYDTVAVIALMALVLTGAIPFEDAFLGFANPAVITVACVMVITQAITQTGIIDFVVRRLTPATGNVIIHIASLSFIAAILSAFMNNVGALALMMPVAIKTAIQNKRSPSLVLMPLAFSSVLGGLSTAIGTPPNLLISAYREKITGHAYAMFDFSFVGVVVGLCAITFISLIGWQLIPKRKAPQSKTDAFEIEDYITEVKVTKNSKVIAKTFQELEDLIEGDFSIIGLIRRKRKRLALSPAEVLQEGDILIIEASHTDLQKLLDAGKMELVGNKGISSESLRSDNIGLIEAVVPQGSRLEGRSAQNIRLRSRYHINLLAISRQGKPFKNRLDHVNLQIGDVVLLQGEIETLRETIVTLDLLPLEERGIDVGLRTSAFIPIGIFAAAILATALQIVPVQIAFTAAVLFMILLNVIPMRKVYQSIDWSIIILLGAIIPMGSALQLTGGTDLIAHGFVALAGHIPPIFILGALFIITMTISDVMNNAATAVVMAPIAVSIANLMQANIDPFLMTVAVGASCSFLTPISHQNNTLVMGPGGYKFQDYLRLGLAVEIIVLFVALPLILWHWPLYT